MSFFSHVFRTVKRTVTHPVRTIKKVVHNPTRAILNRHIRSSKAFKNIGRPIIKVGAGIALGAVTGGVGFAAGAATFGGLSAAGAVAGGLASAAGGGFSNKAFKPVKNIVIPAAAGALAGNLSRLAAVRNLSRGVKLAKTGLSVAKTVKGVRTRKAIIADMRRRTAEARAADGQALKLANSRAELAALKSDQAVALKAQEVKKGVNIAPKTSARHSGFDTGGAAIGAATGALVAGPAGAAIGGIVGGITARRKT